MQNRRGKVNHSLRPGGLNANVTSAVGMEEPAGRQRARRHSLFTQTVMWITGLICIAFLLGSLAQAWSNSQLMQRVQSDQQKLQQLQGQHTRLGQQAAYYKDPAVIESEARQQLGYIRPGEQPVVIVGASNQSTQDVQQKTTPVSNQGYWQDWWHIFFGD